jgi:hypothetical protein
MRALLLLLLLLSWRGLGARRALPYVRACSFVPTTPALALLLVAWRSCVTRAACCARLLWSALKLRAR